MNPFDFSNGFFLLLNTSPPVIYMKDWVLRAPRFIHRWQLGLLRDKPAHVLVQISWTHEPAGMAARLAGQVRRHSSRYRGHRIVILANTQRECELLRAEGLSVLHCNGSVFLSPSVFFPIPHCEKEFDAVYDAALSPYKRHELACEVRRLALIGYVKHDSSIRYIRSALDPDRVTWLNRRPPVRRLLMRPDPINRSEWLQPSEVNRQINRARVGLCLSAVEGFMFASAQYLLAGLPVVTTESRGGRDLFYHPACVRTVPDDPGAVADAVTGFCAEAPSAACIREETLKRFTPHRERFVGLMRDILAGHEAAAVWENGWPEGLPHKLEGSGFSAGANLGALKNGRPPPWLEHGLRNSER